MVQTPKLGQWLSTAVAGNDILSSVFYSAGIAVMFAGAWAPLVLLAIVLVLVIYKFVYVETVEALPVNGGAYNCLLSATSKGIAALAGVMTILAYMANAVISAKVGVEYLATVVSIPVLPVALGLLAAFALLTMAGIKDSARVAAVLFSIHVIALIAFISLGVWFISQGGSVLWENIRYTPNILRQQGGLFPALFLAFSASLLGVSGFEGSANFVEAQKRGVFRKTLHNLLFFVAVFYPLIAIVVIAGLPAQAAIESQDFLLARAASQFGGRALEIFIVVDAFIVLSGAILASYVGVSGLMSRMAYDRCLPMSLAQRNSREAFPRITWLFLGLCVSMLLLTGGRLLSLAGMYTIAFLGVMTAFALGNFILKTKRSRPRLAGARRTPTVVVVSAGLAGAAGIVGNVLVDVRNLLYFALYFFPVAVAVLLIVYKEPWLKVVTPAVKSVPLLGAYFTKKLEKSLNDTFVAFISHSRQIMPILRYLRRNEMGRNLVFVHCRSSRSKKSPRQIEQELRYLEQDGSLARFNVRTVYKDTPFGSKVLEEISRELGVQKHHMLVGALQRSSRYDNLGGVRIVM